MHEQHMTESGTETELTMIVHVRDELGLHARPAARLARTAQAYRSDVRLSRDGRSVDAKSILDILSLAAGRGEVLTLECRGADARDAAQAVSELFARALPEEA